MGLFNISLPKFLTENLPKSFFEMNITLSTKFCNNMLFLQNYGISVPKIFIFKRMS